MGNPLTAVQCQKIYLVRITAKLFEDIFNEEVMNTEEGLSLEEYFVELCFSCSKYVPRSLWVDIVDDHSIVTVSEIEEHTHCDKCHNPTKIFQELESCDMCITHYLSRLLGSEE